MCKRGIANLVPLSRVSNVQVLEAFFLIKKTFINIYFYDYFQLTSQHRRMGAVVRSGIGRALLAKVQMILHGSVRQQLTKFVRKISQGFGKMET